MIKPIVLSLVCFFNLNTIVLANSFPFENAPLEILSTIEFFNHRIELMETSVENVDSKWLNEKLFLLKNDIRSNDCLSDFDPRKNSNTESIYNYLNNILYRLADNSKIINYLDKDSFGICVRPTSSRGPELSSGEILFPLELILAAKSESELAYIIAHEFAHSLLHHELLLKYDFAKDNARNINYRKGRETQAEREADELALKLIYNAGYNLSKAPALLKLLRGKGTSRHFSSNQIDNLVEIVKGDIEHKTGEYLDHKKNKMVEHKPVEINPAIPEKIKAMAKQELIDDGISWSKKDYMMVRFLGTLKGINN